VNTCIVNTFHNKFSKTYMLFFFHKDNANVDVDATGEFFLYTNR